jgi:hypothetical protein
MSETPGRRCRVVGDVLRFLDGPQPRDDWQQHDRAAVAVDAEPVHHEAGELPIGTEVRMQVSRDRVVTVEAATAGEPSAAVEPAAVSAVPTVTAPAPARAVESDDDELGFTHVQVGSDLVSVAGARRLPLDFESFAVDTCETRARVFEVWWPAVPLHAAAVVDRGVVLLNAARLRPPCPIVWLGNVVHECVHVREKHTSQGEDSAEEAEAEEEAKFVVVGLSLNVDNKIPPNGSTPIDAKGCVECFSSQRGPCRQTEATRGRVHQALAKYCEPLGG